jgi:hypothetical protein
MKTTTLFLSIALLFTFNSKAQNVITVDNSVGSNAQYSDLNTAIAIAVAGDTIYIHPSEINYGTITVDKTLHLIGFAHSDPEKATYIFDLILSANASNSSFSGLYITDDFFTSSLATTLTGLVIENCIIIDGMFFNNAGVDGMIIRGNIIGGIGTNFSSGGTYNNYTNTIISNNIFTSRTYLKNYLSIEIKNNIFFKSITPIINQRNGSGSITVQDNIFYTSSSTSVNVNSAGVIFENCLTYNLSSPIFPTLNGSNNINNVDPKFVNATNNIFGPTDDYHLQAGSPAIGTGVAGEDMGIFNAGPFVFNNFGYTNGIPIMKITAITNIVALGANVEVTITTNSN